MKSLFIYFLWGQEILPGVEVCFRTWIYSLETDHLFNKLLQC